VVFDVAHGRLLFQELVAHGRNTGERLAERFSNLEGQQDVEPRPLPDGRTYYGSTAIRCDCAASTRDSTITPWRARS